MSTQRLNNATKEVIDAITEASYGKMGSLIEDTINVNKALANLINVANEISRKNIEGLTNYTIDVSAVNLQNFSIEKTITC